MNTKHLLFAIFLLSVVTGMNAQEVNRLYIPNLDVNAGSDFIIPIHIENDCSNITGIQFTLKLPTGITANFDQIRTTERISKHKVSHRDDSYIDGLSQLTTQGTVMVYSLRNNAVKANAGAVLYLPATSSTTLQQGNILELEISNPVLSDSLGNNVLTSTDCGVITIKKTPVLTVSNVSCDKTEVAPDEAIEVNWTISNIGEAASTGGWSEIVSLISEAGDETVISTQHYNDGSLSAKQQINRQATIILPRLMGLDGPSTLKVVVVPNSDAGVSAAYSSNNFATTEENSIFVLKRLYINTQQRVFETAYTQPFVVSIERSGSWAEETHVQLTLESDARINMATETDFLAGSSTATVNMVVINDDILNPDSLVTITANVDGYDAVSSTFIMEDDELPELTLSASQQVIDEGDSFKLKLSRTDFVDKEIQVKINCEYPKYFSYPATVNFPAGVSELEIAVSALDNEDVTDTISVQFSASALRWHTDRALVLLADNDIPDIVLELTPVMVNESAGIDAIIGNIRRTNRLGSKILVNLSDDSMGRLFYSDTPLVLEKDVEETQFTIGINDNETVDQDLKVNVTAAIYLSSCGCPANGTSRGKVTKTITILDDDGPTLKIETSVTNMQEGTTDNIVTIRRNTTDVEDLMVSLSSDYDEMLEYNHNVVIPTGSTFVQVKVSVKENNISGDSKIVTFIAESEGYTKGICWTKVSDLTLPDGKVTDISLDNSEVESGAIFTVSLVITNDGVEILPSQTPLTFHLTSGKSTVDAYTQQEVLPGQSITLTKQLRMPNVVGSYELYAVLNESRKVKELLYTNNTSQKVAITLLPSFTVTATTDKAVYSKGETICVTGKAEGNRSANATIEVYFINDGLRTTVEATTDDDGCYTAEWTPLETQSGHYSIGACFPKENLKIEMSSCDVYGLKRLKKTFLAHKILQGDNYEGTIDLTNPGNLSLTGVEVVTLGGSAACQASFSLPNKIEANETTKLLYNLTGVNPSTGDDWEIVTAKINTQEGVTLEVPIRYYIEPQASQLIASETDIKTTMTKGTTRDYIVTLTNKGKGETGRISIDLPNTPWLSLGTPASIPSLSQNDSTTIVFKLTPTEDMQLNNVQKAEIGINYGNQGLAIIISAEAVSTVDGTLIIDVCDEATYYTHEAPHLKGATVTIQHPSSLAVLAEGTTGEDGTFTATLHEGLYQVTVTAPYHCSYKNYIQVSPEMETRETVDLNSTAITYSITYEPTEIEDEYEMVTTLNYESRVPIPNVVTKLPYSIPCDELQAGESLIFNAVLTNKGLITANDTYLELPESQESLVFEPLVDGPFDLLAGQTITIPIKVTNTDGTNAYARGTTRATVRLCHLQCITRWHYRCGNRIIPERIVDEVVYHEECREVEVRGGVIPRSGGGGYGLYLPNGNVNPEYVWYDYEKTGSENCNGCVKDFVAKVAGCAANYLPNLVGRIQGVRELDVRLQNAIGAVTNTVPCTINGLVEGYNRMQGKTGLRSKLSYWSGVVGCITSVCTAVADAIGLGAALAGQAEIAGPAYVVGRACKLGSTIANLANCAFSLSEPCNANSNSNVSASRRGTRSQLTEPSYISEAKDKVSICADQLNGYLEFVKETFGEEEWLECDIDELNELMISLMESEKRILSADDFIRLKPENISEAQVRKFIERINNTTLVDEGVKIENDNYIHSSVLDSSYDAIVNAQNRIKELGFEDVMTLFEDAMITFAEDYESKKKSVCSSVTLEFKQKMAMTREAIRGTLTVENGSETNELKGFKLNLKVYDPDGNLADSHIMQISTETMKGLEGEKDMQSGWTLAAGQEGVATILFIPTKYAAPTHSLPYTFAGTISYIDPNTGLEFTNDLSPVTIIINPSPDLDLTYFMQRDILGDDALTEDIVEPSVPAEFALLITNKGYGDAKKVKITTDQPSITENEKGLAINFEMISSSLNGEEKSLAMGQSTLTDFGDIEAHSSSYAQWYLSCNLLGHFNGYNVEATHLTSYGNPDLSLIDNVTVHELIHTLSISDSGKPGWLVNDDVDAHDLPDRLYFTDGTVEIVGQATATTEEQEYNIYKLTITPTTSGWCYGSVPDPTSGRKQLSCIVRQSDGMELPIQNFWQTDRTLRDGKEPLYEFRLHFADNLTTASEIYLLTFEEKTTNAVTSYDLVEGWNWISTNINDPVIRNAQQFLSQISEQTVSLNGQTLEIFNDPQAGLIGNLKTLVPEAGYKLKVSEDVSFKLSGETVEISETPIHLARGWNWIGYPVAYEQPLSDALHFLVPSTDDRIMGYDDFSVYTEGGWLGTLESMQPGKGYMYLSNTDTNFCYAIMGILVTNEGESSGARRHNIKQGIWSYNPHLYADNMSIIAKLLNNEQGTPVKADDYIVAAFCGDECRGIAKVVDSLLFITVHGDAGQNEVITFQVYEPTKSYTQRIEESYLFENIPLGSYSQPASLHMIGKITDIFDSLMENDSTLRIYAPNGRQLTRPQKGVNIIVSGNGSTHKVVVN